MKGRYFLIIGFIMTLLCLNNTSVKGGDAFDIIDTLGNYLIERPTKARIEHTLKHRGLI